MKFKDAQAICDGRSKSAPDGKASIIRFAPPDETGDYYFGDQCACINGSGDPARKYCEEQCAHLPPGVTTCPIYCNRWSGGYTVTGQVKLTCSEWKSKTLPGTPKNL